MLIKNLDLLPDVFKEGYRGILLIHRNKDGCEGNAQRKAFKRISRNKQEWLQIINEYEEMRKSQYPNYRIYSHVNMRNMEKAIRLFKERQLEADYDKNENHHGFYTDITNRFFSCFSNPQASGESWFLLDCDSTVEYEECMSELSLHDIYKYDYRTRNGYHIITSPFNPNKLNLPVEIKRDALIAIA